MELTGMNRLLPMYCNSTAVPCPPVMPPDVPMVVRDTAEACSV